jgi:uncharacterized protein
MRPQLRSLCARTGLLLSGALILSACSMPAQPSAISPTTKLVTARTMTVVGEGEATARPDIARMNLGVEATAPTVSAALSEANRRMSAVIAAVKRAGVPDKDIQTSNFSIHFERPPRPLDPVAPPGPGVYRVSNMVDVTVRDPDKAGLTLEAAVNAGANSVWNVTFALDDTKAVEARARAEAVEDARTRAEDLARLNGLRLGQVTSVSTIIGAEPVAMKMVMEAGAAYDAAPPLEAGELTWRTQVQIIFELTP